MSDFRTPRAKARDEWLESYQGTACQDGAAEGENLRNRLEAAFLAGYDWGEAVEIARKATEALKEGT